MTEPRSISAVNDLPQARKEAIYRRFIPEELITRFRLPASLIDRDGNGLLSLRCRAGTTDAVISLRHTSEAEDPILFAHLTDTMNGQIHVLLYILNDPASPRFDVDRMPDGTPTEFGSFHRNLEAERAALMAGLAPGQVRSGLRLLRHSIEAFEGFVASLGHDVYFIDPLAYHNAVVFERYGFHYQQGRKKMEQINLGFQPGGELYEQLDGTTPFRVADFHDSIRGRSWAIHDGILGEPFTDVIMYKRLGQTSIITTFPDASW